MRKLYHATHISNRKSILEKGLEPRLSKRYDIYQDERIYLFDNLDNPPLDYVGFEYIDIWEVLLDDSYEINDDTAVLAEGYKNSYYIKKAIPPQNISLVQII